MLSRKAYPSHFNRLWAEFDGSLGGKGSKGEAYDAYKLLKCNEEDSIMLIKVLQRQKVEKMKARALGEFYANFKSVKLWLKHRRFEDEASEFVGIVNYCIMALIQLEKGVVEQPDLSVEEATELYDEKVEVAKQLMQDKNHDYGEAWRDMRVSSLTDLILQKLLRVKQIEDNAGKTIVSEGINANYQDMINYAVFALIHLKNC